MDLLFSWMQEHLLSIFALTVTLVLFIHHVVEKEYAIKLSKRYRNSIFETQSKIFLNATQYLISGNKDLAIKEFLNAVDLNRETIETYFTLGGLFRSNGELEKAISIHRSLIARDNISEATRLRALKELALDFDKGGLIDKAIETYKDVLRINPDQVEAIGGLCRIYEDLEDWDEAYRYRLVLSKVTHENQSETISHILIQKAKVFFDQERFAECLEIVEEAFKFAPSVSAKILRLQLYLVEGSMDEAKVLLEEMLREHPIYASFIFVSLSEIKFKLDKLTELFQQRLSILKTLFLSWSDRDLLNVPSVILSKIRLLKAEGRSSEAFIILKEWIGNNKNCSEMMKIEYIKLLIDLDKNQEALKEALELLNNLYQSLARHYCGQCGYNSDHIFWRCPQCREWETIHFRWKV